MFLKSLIPLLPLNLNIAISVQYKKNMTDRSMQLQSFIYCKNFKSTTKSNPNDDALQPQSSLAEYSRFVWGAEQNLCY